MSVDSALDPPVPPAVASLLTAARHAQARGDLHEAARHLDSALQQAGEHPQLLEEAGVVATHAGDLADAEAFFRRAIAQRPLPGTHLNLAIVVYRQKRFQEAASLFAAIFPYITITPELADAYAFSLERCGAPDAAIQIREQVLAQAPGESHAIALASTLLRQRRHDVLASRWAEWFERFPDNADLRSLAAEQALGLGDYPRGFALLEERLRLAGSGLKDALLADCPRWDGKPFDGTLLVTLEPNLGEEILVSSLLLPLVERRQRTRVELDRRLLPLFRRSFPSLEFVGRGEHALAEPLRAGETCRLAQSIDLARLLDRRFVLPGLAGWLQADMARTAALRATYRIHWPNRKIVGISWRSLRHYNELDLKSLPLTLLPETLSLPDTQFIALQYGDTTPDLAGARAAGLPVPWQDPHVDATNDIDGLAAQLCAVDLFVTVSNTTAHLAGALGVPTIVLLPGKHPVLWHWGYDGDRSTWYESMHLLRNTGEDWAAMDPVIAARIRDFRREI